MEEPRDIQNFRRNERIRATVSSCSSLNMEIKRKKIRQSSLFLHNEESKIQEKIDFEIRMRDGAYKLLGASTKREQILSVSKNLLTCNTRIKAYLTELQNKKDLETKFTRRLSGQACNNRLACKGKVAISGLRIPLLWKDSDHFNNKGSSRKVAVFCLMKVEAEVFDTEMVIVDRSVTDICFEGLTLFNEARPHFDLSLEIYSCNMEEERSLMNTPKKLARKFRTSFGKSTGKRACHLVEGADPETFLQYNPIPPDASYSLLAYATLHLEQAEGTFQSHSLVVMQNEESSSWLPLYGNLCCRLVAQPDCMTQPMMSGFLSQQQNIDGAVRCCDFFCVLKAANLSCYYTPEEIEAKVEPSLVIPVNKETRIRMVPKELQKRPNHLVIINPVVEEAETYIFTAENKEDLEKWMEAFQQHFYDQDQWRHCCNELLEIDIASPRKPPLFLTKPAESVYNDLSISSPSKFESLTDIIHNKIEETGGRFLIDQEKETEPPHWAALFEGSCPMVVQKTVLSPGKESQPSPKIIKKRRAPPPPPGKEPFALGRCSSHQLEKENSKKKPWTRTGRPSLDNKFSAIIQQLQKNQEPARKTAPLGLIGIVEQDCENQIPDHLSRPVPAPRQRLRSFREKMNHKDW
uniref:Rhotekin 2 n=1 Tax=Paramormyrops kingsleyae TaxID=1676925 RepID=A0A3B3Q6S8_9TELE|nr:rhotekin-2-like isoform X1 [Paramormyrops kingsleyae]